MVLLLKVEQVHCIVPGESPALSQLLSHPTPQFFLCAAFVLASTVAALVGGQVAEAIILKVQSNFEVRGVSLGNLYILSPQFEFGLPLQEVQIVVDPSYSFAAGPVLAEQFDEDIGHEDGVAILVVFVKV